MQLNSLDQIDHIMDEVDSIVSETMKFSLLFKSSAFALSTRQQYARPALDLDLCLPLSSTLFACLQIRMRQTAQYSITFASTWPALIALKKLGLQCWY